MGEGMTRWLQRVILVGGAAAVGAVLVSSFRSGAADVPRPKDVQVSARAAQSARGGQDRREELGPAGWIAGPGVVEPAEREVRVGAGSPGLIRKILVEEGQVVKAGAPLLELDAEVERAQLEAASAEVRRLEAEVERVRTGRRPEEQRALAADAKAAEVRAQLSLAVLRRQERLRESGAATADELDRAKLASEVDEAVRRAQEARLQAASSGWARDVDVAVAQVGQARARQAEARARFERLTVRAPSAGTVLQIIAREGEFFNPAPLQASSSGGALLLLGDLSQLRVRMDVDDRNIGSVRVGQKGIVVVEGRTSRRVGAQVVEVGRRMGRKNVRTDEPTERIDTKILEVVLALEGAEGLIPGQRVYAYLEPTP